MSWLFSLLNSCYQTSIPCQLGAHTWKEAAEDTLEGFPASHSGAVDEILFSLLCDVDFRLNKVFSCQKHLDQVPIIYLQDKWGTITFAKANTRVTPPAGPQRHEAAELWASPGSPGGFSSTMCLCPVGKGGLIDGRAR